MEKRSTSKAKALIPTVLAIILLAVALRIPNLDHTLYSDEAFDSMSVYEHANFEHQYWGLRLSAHPPLYLGAGLAFAKLTGAHSSNIALFLMLVSILAALGTVVLIFLCGKEWFDDRVGLLAAFFYAVLPAARVFDTFIKQDSLMVLFVMAFLYVFFKKKYLIGTGGLNDVNIKGTLLAGLLLGLAFLSKEPAFFIPIVAGAFLLVEARFRELLRLVGVTLLAAAMSFWWYAFFSASKGQFIDFFLGRSIDAQQFHEPWYHYIVRVPHNLGWVVMALCLVALAFFILRFKQERKGMVPFLLIWIGVLYVIFSASYGKPPWIITISLPPFALLGAWGLAQVAREVRARNRRAATVVVACVLVGTLGLSIAVSFGRYMRQVDPEHYDIWVSERKMADAMNRWCPRRVVMYQDDAEPVFFYYLEPYDYQYLGYIPANAPPDTREKGKGVILIDNKTSYDDFLRRIAAVYPDFVVVRKYPALPTATGNPDRTSLIDAIEKNLGIEPEKFDDAYVFRLRAD